MNNILDRFEHEAVVVINVHSLIQYVSGGVQEVFGWAPKELKGKLLTELMPESYRTMHILGMDRYILSGVKGIDWNSTNLQGLKKDRSVIPIQISFGEFERHNERYFVGIICDTSEGKSLKDTLSSGMIEELAKLIYNPESRTFTK